MQARSKPTNCDDHGKFKIMSHKVLVPYDFEHSNAIMKCLAIKR